jgi:threonine/homoserine/homoserine lactone efflux protein
MLPLLLLKGSVIGLSISMPMGPTGMQCLQNAVTRGKAFGMASGMGIAFAECCCGGITILGLSSLTSFIENNQQLLQLIGSLFLLFFGIKTLKTDRKEDEKPQDKQSGYFKVFFMMFILTITNPLTLLSFVAIFSAMGIETLENDWVAVSLLSGGVFLGSTAWWVLVSSSSSYFLGKIRSSSAKKINRILGISIIMVSLFSFVFSLKSLLTD